MARTKESARKSTGGRAPRRQLVTLNSSSSSSSRHTKVARRHKEDILYWRKSDPYSDCKLVVKKLLRNDDDDEDKDSDTGSEDDETTTTYNVRKAILGFGPRASVYFTTVFASKRFSESRDNTCRVELSEPAAEAIPAFLDYMYSAGTEDSFFTSENAAALYWLADYFDVPCLRDEAKNFCLEDMERDMENYGIYYQHAKMLNADALLEAVATFIRDNIHSIPYSGEDSPLVQHTDVQFWVNVIEAARGSVPSSYTDGTEYHGLGNFIANFCEYHDVSADKLIALTNDLPTECISHAAAFAFLELNSKLCKDSSTDLSPLQRKCARALARGEDFQMDDERRSILDKTPKLAIEILEQRAAS